MDERFVACAALGAARGIDAAAAAVGVACALELDDGDAPLVIDLRRDVRPPRGTLLASAGARGLEQALRELEGWRAAARGRLCFAVPERPREGAGAPAAGLKALLDVDAPSPIVLCLCEGAELRTVLGGGGERASGVLVRALPGAERSLIALLACELRAEGVALKAWTVPIGTIPARRAIAGLEPGGASGRRAKRFASVLGPGDHQHEPAAALGPAERARARLQPERGQALPGVLGLGVLVVALALILVAIGGAATAKGRLQRSADLAAISAARSMRDDFGRLFIPALRPDGTANPAHLERAQYLERARVAGELAAERNGVEGAGLSVRFPDGDSVAPLRVRIELRENFQARADGPNGSGSTKVAAEAEVTPPVASGATSSQPTTASGGGYSGPLAYRQGKPMRPDVATAFDQMAAAAARAGISLVVNSAFRSDAEQQKLWEQNPDPRWVAPPGTSLHRCGTELDLGPSSAYGWLAANAPHFQFTQRYSWEAWHFGFDGRPAPCSAEGDRVGSGSDPGSGAGVKADGKVGSSQGLPAFVPPQLRGPLLASAARHNVSAALLAAQLMAESNFNPNAVSPVGAQGLAQFMPATAAAYGLSDPFDPIASIDAQAQLMGDLIAQFGSVELALAAYNAGPGAVAGCNCVPPYPETQAYVARIMGLLGGAGQLAAPALTLEVRLVD